MLEKITLMELYVIETLRANGIADEAILEKAQAGEVEEFAHYNEKFDFTILSDLAKAGRLEKIITDGYEVTFLTFTGLVNILKLKYNKIEEKDFKVKDYTVSELQLADEELATLTQLLSPNWTLTKLTSGVTISPIATPQI